ncbi:MAG TPA: hypothetical protein VF768_02085 [Holophagaceae bacterium]
MRSNKIPPRPPSTSEASIRRSLIPVCSWCLKIRNEAGLWVPADRHGIAFGEAGLTHGLCPDCRQRHFPRRKAA